MKKVIITTLMSFLIALTINAQSSEKTRPLKKIMTVEFTVDGVCDMCEKRIEKAALVKGVKLAEWNKETRIIKVIFSTKKTNQETIEKAIAAVGYDTENFKADDEDYNNLPDCCSYRGDLETH